MGKFVHVYTYKTLHTLHEINKLLSRPWKDSNAECAQFSKWFTSRTAILYMKCISRIFSRTYWYSWVNIFCISFLIILLEILSSIFRKLKQDLRSQRTIITRISMSNMIYDVIFLLSRKIVKNILRSEDIFYYFCW